MPQLPTLGRRRKPEHPDYAYINRLEAENGMPLTKAPVTEPGRVRRRDREALAKSERLGSIAKAAIALSPPVQGKRDFARPADIHAWARATTANIAPTAGATPADIEAALLEEGMQWQSAFSPGPPQEPFYGYDRQPRSWDYTPGRNVAVTPRAQRIPFGTLEKVISGYDIPLICTRHIISDITSMKIMVQPMDGLEEDVTKEIDAARTFLRKPDGKRSFRSWISAWQQDIIRYDAGALYKKRDNAGNVMALKVVSGPTIAPQTDYFGERPDAPAPAFLQVIEGIPWDWLNEDDLIYEPFTPLPEDVYGLSPIECVLLNANLDVRFQWFFLQKFTAGTVPEGFMKAPPDQSSPDQIEEWQETFDAWMMGDQEKLHQIRWVPAGSDFMQTKDQQFSDEFPEYMMRRTVAAFGVTPADLGFTSDINKATSDTQSDVQFRISTEPRTGHVEDILDDVLQNDLGLRVQVRFDTGREKDDRLSEAQAHQIYISCGVESPDEPRTSVLGLEVDKENPVPRGFLSERLGFMPLEYAVSTGGDIDPATAAPRAGTVIPTKFVIPGNMAPDPDAAPGDQDKAGQMLTTATPNKGDNAIDDTGAGGGQAALPPGDVKAPPPGATPPAKDGRREDPAASTDTEIVKEATAGITADTGIAGADLVDPDDEETAKKLKQWKDNSKGRVKKGLAPRLFDDMPTAVVELVWPDLSRATTTEAVNEAFAKAVVTAPKV